MQSSSRTHVALAAGLGLCVALAGGGSAVAAEAPQNIRISTGHDGSEADGPSNAPAVSDDGRWFAYSSNATNIVPGDTNGKLDLFLYDRVSGTNELVTRGLDGAPANERVGGERISNDGRFVTFYSEASNLVPDDTDGLDNVFVWDRDTKEITRLPGADALWPDISADGRYVTYSTTAALAPEDHDELVDIYVYDRAQQQAVLVTKTLSGGPAGGFDSTISDDGRYVAFMSDSRELTSEPVGASRNVFLRDLRAGTTTLVSTPPNGASNGISHTPAISGDGRFVAFGSASSTLVPGDANNDTDIFLWERDTREITLVSATPDGRAADGFSADGRVSADGSYVTFWSTAADLSGQTAEGWTHAYLFDRRTKRNRAIGVPTAGTEGGGEGAEVSADGRVVGFLSSSGDLVPGDRNGHRDTFVTVLD